MSTENHVAEKSPPQQRRTLKSLAACPPTAPISTVLSLVLLLALLYGSLWGLTGDSALPGGPIFSLFVLEIACYLGGQIIRLIKIPTLVGMMVSGFLLRNIPAINLAKDIPEEWGGTIRHMALILILLRAGLEVEADVLKTNKATCSKLIFIPFILEFCTGAVVCRFLFDMPWIWSFLMGTMLSAVSPAVVLPVMLKMQKKGIGTQNGVPTLVIAVAGIDDVIALTAFEVVLGITFATGSLGWTIAQGPLEVIAGIIYGVILGIVSWYLPNSDEKSTDVLRFLILIFGGMCVLFASQALDWGAAGALGCICLPFVAALRWKQKNWDDENNPVGNSLAFLWRIIEPALFGLIGSEIRIEYLQPSTVGLGLAIMFAALALRMVGSMLSGFGAGLTIKEQIFVTFAGLPKATVQAAIGPVALSMARKLSLGHELEEYGIKILTVAVLAILITAPFGALAISLLAPRLLEKDTNHKPPNQKNEANDTVLPMYDNQNSYNAYITRTRHDSKVGSISSGNNIYSIAKL